jgi:hypothetical protein
VSGRRENSPDHRRDYWAYLLFLIAQLKIGKSTRMAKSKSILDLQGTFRGMTFVHSRAYGDHLRAARGTHKKAKINNVLKKEGELLVKANKPAKILHDAIKIYRDGLRDRLISRKFAHLKYMKNILSTGF